VDDYGKYFLTDNPFPRDPSVNPFDPDKRNNGSIFNVEIRQRELQELRAKIESKLIMVYLRASFKVKGMGKSAIAVQEWKRVQGLSDVTSVYLDARSRGPQEFCEGIVRAWHDAGYLWNAVKDILQTYATGESAPAIEQDVVEDIARSSPSMPTAIDLRRYIYKGSVSSAIKKVAEWTVRNTPNVLQEVAESFFETYLSRPPEFPRVHSAMRRKMRGYDEIDCFRSMLQLLRNTRYRHHYVFLDSFEEPIVSKGRKELREFCSDMRRVLEAGTGYLTVVVTLHLDANTRLRTQSECFPLTEIAPNDPRYVVDIERLDADRSAKLAVTYLDHFRGNYSPPHSLYPFRTDAITLIHNEADGNTRRILRMLCFAIDEGRKKGFPEITEDFIKERHEDIVGKVPSEA